MLKSQARQELRLYIPSGVWRVRTTLLPWQCVHVGQTLCKPPFHLPCLSSYHPPFLPACQQIYRLSCQLLFTTRSSALSATVPSARKDLWIDICEATLAYVPSPALAALWPFHASIVSWSTCVFTNADSLELTSKGTWLYKMTEWRKQMKDTKVTALSLVSFQKLRNSIFGQYNEDSYGIATLSRRKQ